MSAQSRKSVTRLPVAEKSLLSHFSRFRTSSAVQTAHPDARQRTTRPSPRPARSHESPNARVNVAPPTRDMSDDEQEKQRSSASPAPAVGTARKADATGASADEPPARRQKVTRGPRVRARRVLPGARQGRGPRRPRLRPQGGARVFSRFFKSRDETRRSRAPGRHPLRPSHPSVSTVHSLPRLLGRPHGGALGDQRGRGDEPDGDHRVVGVHFPPRPARRRARARGLGAPLRRQRRPRLRRGDSTRSTHRRGHVGGPRRRHHLRWRLEGSTEDVDDSSTATRTTRRIPTSFTSRNPSRTPPGTSPCTR